MAQLGTGGKAHYAALDGLRAIAALAVLYLHQLGFFGREFRPPPPLAVDFFFMLSGFVLAHAYGRKLDGGLGWSRYMAARIVRVYPMLLLGVVLGGLLALARYTHGHAGPDQNVLTFLASLVLAPVGLLYIAKDYPYDSPNVFPFNGIVWSLFFAMVASAVYASPVRKLSRGSLIACFILCCVAWAAGALWAGSISALGRHGLIGFLGGFPRVAVPFAIGAALYGLAAYQRFPSVPFAVPAVVLMALLILPLGDRLALEVAYIFVAFPLLICVGARSPGDRLCRWLGRLSYPLYVIQLPLSEAVGSLVKTHITQQPVAIIAASMLVCILFSWIALVFYDEPIRRRLGLLLKRKDRLLPSAVAT